MRNTIQLSASLLALLAITFACDLANAQDAQLGFGIDSDVELVANTADQRVDLFATNIAGKAYDTFELFILIGDGGTAAGGTDTGPRLTDVELGGVGSAFEGGQRGDFPSGSQTGLLWADFIDSVVATDDGVVGTLIFDTTGFDAGTTIDIRFEGIAVGGTEFNTNFRNADTTENVSPFSNGTIRVVNAIPEPSSAIILFAVTGLVGLRRRR